MINRVTTLSACLTSLVLVTACSGDNSSFETPNTDLATNSGTIAQNNFTILADPFNPAVFNTTDGTFTAQEATIVVNIGDRFNRVLSDKHEIYFRTEWGLLKNSSCTTQDGTCSVIWQSGDPKDFPADGYSTVTAYTIGEESFIDTNDNGKFDDQDTTFTDIEEPYVDSNFNGIYDSGEPIIDVPNGNDTTGKNGVHDTGDTFYNGPACTNSSLCSTVMKKAYIWADMELKLFTD